MAPHAKIELATDPIGHFGTFFGRDIEVHQETTIWSHPYEGPWPFTLTAGCSNGSLDSNESDIDCGGVCGATCQVGQMCADTSDCVTGVCTAGQCQSAAACSQETAVDLGIPGNAVSVPADGCVMVRDGYPEWWGTRPMQLQSSSGSGYPIAFEWSNACTSAGGSAIIMAVLGPGDDQRRLCHSDRPTRLQRLFRHAQVLLTRSWCC